MYDVGGKLLNGIKIMYSLAFVRVKEGESECFKIDRLYNCIMSL